MRTAATSLYLVRAQFNRQVVAHELVHVLQYERLGGIELFLRSYVREVYFPPYYPYGPLEREADRVATTVCREA